RCLCHEIDHLDGHLYVEKVEGDLLTNEQLAAMMEDEEEEE
ncbi:MAG: peptide deformylase, partial [Lachnospiraceae bacterium]|nr:peptide deformylase [Lachnospiraceae bacterium]